MTDVIKIPYIRHGQTTFNIISPNLELKIKNRGLFDYIDCQLSDEGKKGADELRNTLVKHKIRFCFVSPLLRCLETCERSTKGLDIEIIVHPYLNEVIESIADISVNIEEKKKQYSRFNWSYFDKIIPTSEQEFYYLSFIDNQIKSEFDLKSNFQQNILDLLNNCWKDGNRAESINGLNQRQIQFKHFLKNFIEKLENEERIFVFSHYNFIKISSSKTAELSTSLNEIPDDSVNPKNLEETVINIRIKDNNDNQELNKLQDETNVNQLLQVENNLPNNLENETIIMQQEEKHEFIENGQNPMENLTKNKQNEIEVNSENTDKLNIEHENELPNNQSISPTNTKTELENQDLKQEKEEILSNEV